MTSPKVVFTLWQALTAVKNIEFTCGGGSCVIIVYMETKCEPTVENVW